MARLAPTYIRLGFDSYADYLQSALWYRIRKRILQRDRGCVDCGVMDTPLHVHHLRYTLEVFDGRDDTGLVALCVACHKERHRGRSMSEFKYDEDFQVSFDDVDFRHNSSLRAEPLIDFKLPAFTRIPTSCDKPSDKPSDKPPVQYVETPDDRAAQLDAYFAKTRAIIRANEATRWGEYLKKPLSENQRRKRRRRRRKKSA